MVVHELVERGVPHGDIKRMIWELRERYGSDWPLTQARLGTTGKRLAVEADEATYDLARLGALL